MKAEVSGQLWVKRADQAGTLTAQYGTPDAVRPFEGGEHRHTRSDALDYRCPDKYSVKGVSEPVDGQIGLERVHLATEGVAPHLDVDTRELMLIGSTVRDATCEQDHSRARPERGKTLPDPPLERLEQA